MSQQQDTEERGLLGKLCPGEKKLKGKTFYLDNVKKRPTTLLLEALSLLGGTIESFLHKDVNFVVTGNQEGLKEDRGTVTNGREKETNEGTQHPNKQQESVLTSEKRQPGTPRPVACSSRGKALLEKAIRNNERLQGSSVLTNARSWGVKILYVDDVLLYLKRVTRESFNVKHKRSERTCTKQSSHVVKATALRAPYLKIEDFSRKYRPLHMQSMTFPSLCYVGRFSPFESFPPRFEKPTEEGKSKTREKKKVESSIQEKSQPALPCNPSPWRARKKDTSYCECCQQPFANLDEHLQSDQHRMFVLDPSNYSVVDQLVAQMLPGFDTSPCRQSEDTLSRPPTPLPVQDVCELEPLTDGEVDRAVLALRRQSSTSHARLSSPTRDCPSTGPASLRVQFPISNRATPPTDIQSTPTKGPFPDFHHRAASPVMPVLDMESPAHASETPCKSPDPYSLPPVLSPQVHYSSHITDMHNLYSDPPVLSPQQYSAEEPMDGIICETDTAVTLFKSLSNVSVSNSAPPVLSLTVANAEEVNGSSQGGLLVFSKIVCSYNGSERTLPPQSATPLNPKKRCRSASSECIHSKRRRKTGKFEDYKWIELGHEYPKPESGGCLCFDKAPRQKIQHCPHKKASSACTVEAPDLKRTLTLSRLPTVQNFTVDLLGHVNTSVSSTPTQAKAFDLPLQFPAEKSHGEFSSQDSQRSLSHSTSVCIESALIPDLAALSPSSDLDWDCDLLLRLGTPSAARLSPNEPSVELDKELLHKPCTWTHNTSYESRLHNVLQPSSTATLLCGEKRDTSAFSRTVVQIVEVQH